jgi:hypothetical protein
MVHSERTVGPRDLAECAEAGEGKVPDAGSASFDLLSR